MASDVNGASQSATAALTKLSSLQGQSDISSSIETLVYGFQRISKAVSIELQREAFIALSEQLIDWASQGKSAEETLYVQFCPMANNNLGAKWISTEAEIRNPYYGDAMLTCGSVAELLSL